MRIIRVIGVSEIVLIMRVFKNHGRLGQINDKLEESRLIIGVTRLKWVSKGNQY